MKKNHILSIFITTAFFISSLYYFVNPFQIGEKFLIICLLFPMVFGMMHGVLRVYLCRINFTFYFRLLSSWLGVYLILIYTLFLLDFGDIVSRTSILYVVLSSFIFDLIYLSVVMSSANNKLTKVLVITEEESSELIKNVKKEYHYIGKIKPDHTDHLKKIFDMAPNIILINLPVTQLKFIEELRSELIETEFEILWMPVDYSFDRSNFLDYKVFNLNHSFLSSSSINTLMKRLIDFFGAFLIIVILMPVLLLVSVAIKFSSAGPIFFHQKRQGLNGQVFKMLKFRSMKLHDDSSYVQTQMNDTRITKIGGFLRKYSIDELPQLINVLRGDMSLVGPRPHALDINKKYKKTINKFMSRHKVRPGMTGLAQVKGYRGGDNLEDMKMRTFYDLKYINSWSLFLDIKILLKTIPALFEEKAY